VLATQNPIEQEGTYPLPEAQADRFLVKVKVGYPKKIEEREILTRSNQPEPTVDPVMGPAELARCKEVLGLLRMEAVVADYIVELVHATRFPAEVKLPVARFIEFGASPRATLALAKAARAHALLAGRGYVTPDDVKAVGLDCLRHRVLLNYEAEADGVGVESVIESVFSHVRTP